MKWTVKFHAICPNSRLASKRILRLLWKLDWVMMMKSLCEGKKIISQLANFFENQNFLLSGMLSFKSTIPVFCFIRTAHRLRKAKLMVWQNIFICCPNSREDFSPLHGRKLLVSMGWGCNEPSFSDSSCVTGFALPWEWRDDSSTRGSIRVANL